MADKPKKLSNMVQDDGEITQEYQVSLDKDVSKIAEYLDNFPRCFTQSAQPTIDADSFAFWKDTDDSKYYLLKDFAGTTKVIELATATQTGIVQQVYSIDGAYASGSTAIPDDNTRPEVTEGTEFLSKSITPTSATNKLKIDTVVNFGISDVNLVCAALFVNGSTNAIACGVTTPDSNGADKMYQIKFSHIMTAPSAGATAYTVRVGGNGGATIHFNGFPSAQKFGGALASSITIQEIQL